MRLFLLQLVALALLVIFFTSMHQLAGPPSSHCARVLCARASTMVRCSSFTSPNQLPLDYEDVRSEEHRLCGRRKFPYCHAGPIPFFRELDEDYFDVWPQFGCERDLVPDDYPDGVCGPIGHRYMCAPAPLAPLR